MFPEKRPIVAPVDSKTYPLGEKSEQPTNGQALALVALSHSALEHRLYSAMLSAGAVQDNGSRSFTARNLMTLTGIRSLSTIRRGLEGLLAKLSIERKEKSNGNKPREFGATYLAFAPEEIITRRNERGIGTYEKRLTREGNHSFERAISARSGKRAFK